jgi:hypothetical protein
MSNQNEKAIKIKLTEYLNPKFTLDVSFLLATIIAGAGIVEAITMYCKNDPKFTFAFPLLCQAATVIITTLRFFNGNVMWNYLNFQCSDSDKKLSLAQRTFQRLSSYYVHIIQYALFFLAAHAVGDAKHLLKMMLLISVIDVVWTIGGWKHTCNQLLSRALLSWWIINLFSAFSCWIYKKYFFSSENVTSYFLASVFSIAALIDYLYNSELYFGFVKSNKK